MSERTNSQVSAGALRKVRMLSSLNDDQLATLAEQCAWSRHDSGREILTQDMTSNEVYFICRGRVSAKTFSEKGKEITFAELLPGDTFGELSALDGRPRSSFVVTLEETLLASLKANAFNALLNQYPEAMRAMMIELTRRLREADEKLFEFSTLNTQNRIYAELLRLARAHPAGTNQADLNPAPTHADLASRTNTTRESVTRALNRLKKESIIDASRQSIQIHDVERLTLLIRDAEEE